MSDNTNDIAALSAEDIENSFEWRRWKERALAGEFDSAECTFEIGADPDPDYAWIRIRLPMARVIPRPQRFEDEEARVNFAAFIDQAYLARQERLATKK